MKNFKTVFKKCFLREQFWISIYLSIYLSSIFENVVFEGAISKVYFLSKPFWESLMKNNFFSNTNCFNESPLTFICNSYSGKEYLKIEKQPTRPVIFNNFPNNIRVTHITQQIWEIMYL